MRASTLKIILLVFSFSILFAPKIILADNSGTTVSLHVYNCNNNGICEPQFGENYLGCPMECSAPTSTPTSTTVTKGLGEVTSIGSYGPIPSTIAPNSIKILFLSDSTAVVEWTTYGKALETLSWGKTVDGELGTISEINFGSVHAIELDNLDPNTKYFYKIQSVDEMNRPSYTGVLSFVTPNTITELSNVKNFSFTIEGSLIRLKWQNPTDSDFMEVKLVRSEFFYPTNPDDGLLIYEGDGNNFLDTSVKVGVDYYYSIFALDQVGNFSSGALLHLRIIQSSSTSTSPLSVIKTPPSFIKSGTTTSIEVGVEQNNSQKYFYDNQAEVYNKLPIRFFASITTLPKNFSKLLLSVEDENNPGIFNTFNMEEEGSNNTYEAIIDGFNKIGPHHFFISIVDSNNNTLEQQDGILNVVSAPTRSYWQYLYYWWWVIILLLILGLIIWLNRHFQFKTRA